MGAIAGAVSTNGAGVERIEVVDADHGVAAGRQRLAQVRPDEPRRARHEDTEAHRRSPWKYSIVRRRPASSGTFGSQPKTWRAWVMSGWRTLGSSVGSGRSTTGLRLPVRRSTTSASWRTVNSS